jgi:hypothetical protein
MIDNALDTFHIDLNRLAECAVENAMKIRPCKSRVVSFVIARLKDPLNYFLEDQSIPEASSCRYLRIT